jgi:hypothetical protein
MTPAQLDLVPDAILRHGDKLLDYCHDRGIRPPNLLDLERERVRRGIRRALARPRRPVFAHREGTTEGSNQP